MKAIMKDLWTVIKVAAAYSCAAIGLIIWVPAQLVTAVAQVCIGVGERIMNTTRVDHGADIIRNIIDMDM